MKTIFVATASVVLILIVEVVCLPKPKSSELCCGCIIRHCCGGARGKSSSRITARSLRATPFGEVYQTIFEMAYKYLLWEYMPKLEKNSQNNQKNFYL